jgi:hypothetical protein
MQLLWLGPVYVCVYVCLYVCVCAQVTTALCERFLSYSWDVVPCGIAGSQIQAALRLPSCHTVYNRCALPAALHVRVRDGQSSQVTRVLCTLWFLRTDGPFCV